MEKAQEEKEARKIATEIATLIAQGKIKTKEELAIAKQKLAKNRLSGVVKNSLIFEELSKIKKLSKKEIELLKIRSTRNISGVAVIAIMLKPENSCPFNCTYCPSSKNAPKSYTGEEPSSLRARQCGYDPYRITKLRIWQLKVTGHNTQKCEIIFQGGTFNYRSFDEQKEIVKRTLDALNEEESKSLEEAIKKNEKAKNRAIGITFETRPDFCKLKDVKNFLSLGATRIELGVQTLDNRVYKITKRGHKVFHVINATRNCKDNYLKVLYQMMPGLYADKKKDIAIAKKLFKDQRFRPDMLKLYPLLILKNTQIYEEWKKGKLKVYDDEEAIEVISEILKIVPKYCRVMRIDRDIPSKLIVAGPKHTNLRQIAEKRLKEEGFEPREIRSREVGIRIREGKKVNFDKVELLRYDYDSSYGKEIFLSFEDIENDILIGFLRLRIPGNRIAYDFLEDSSGVRELHVYGEALGIGEKPLKEFQHRGFGKKLLKEAEEITKKEFGLKKIFVMSGIGVREYYRKLGYKLLSPYMFKEL
ncbi:MAG: tRNA uridine(34) 5-carboxymethylaminomethyl modification radical SAM/GNAT enzyme Elp3 [Candidatus Micrarchaeales archaeon]